MYSGLAREFGITGDASDIVERGESRLRDQFVSVDQRAERLQYRVVDIFRRHEVSSRHFDPSTGYGYGDDGRDKLCSVLAAVMGAEDAIVSPLIMSGTHAIGMALFGLLRPGDRALCVTGMPYDTVRQVIWSSAGSLEELGIDFEIVPLRPDHRIDTELASCVLQDGKRPAMVYFQRSTGYDLRPAFTTGELGDAMRVLRPFAPEAVFFVDNCYGEFVCDLEPTAAGADIIAGSMIKNPGGGLAPTGGYVAGKHHLIERIGSRYSVPGVGREIGSYSGGYRAFYQGLFMAPHIVSQALKGVMLAADSFSELGYCVSPGATHNRGDITQVIVFGNEGALTRFVRGIQRASAVDAHVVPNAWDMPGYDDKVIMAAGTFVQGASLEMTADAPIRAPFAAYLQGGLTYSHAKLGVLCALSDVLNE